MSGFSNIRRVANFHAVGMLPICMEKVKSRAKCRNNEVVVPSLSTSLCMLSGPGAIPCFKKFNYPNESIRVNIGHKVMIIIHVRSVIIGGLQENKNIHSYPL